MRTEWSPAFCSVQPKEFERLNEHTYIQRRNFVLVEDEEYGPKYVGEFRYISDDIFNEIIGDRAINNTNSIQAIELTVLDMYEQMTGGAE